MSGFMRHDLARTTFDLPVRYQNLKLIGFGGYGAVCSATDTTTGEKVAIKKILKGFATAVHGKRTCREVQLLGQLKHENIISLKDVFSPHDREHFDDIYLVMELLDADLRRVIYTQDLTEEHVKFFIYQILKGLKYVHSADIVHRDLKPGNIAVNEDCGVKILDFGLARQSDPEMTGYVATRHYRAPEIMLNWRRYDKAVDVWSVGCIMAECLNKKTLFDAQDYVTHISMICQVVGTPDEETIASIGSQDAQQFIRDLPRYQPCGFDVVCPTASAEAVDFLSKCLVFDGKRRMNVLEALEHPFLARFHNPVSEPILDSKFDFSKYEEKDYTVDEWKQMVWDEIQKFHHTATEARPLYDAKFKNNI
eukprot:CFRG0929T1